MIGGAAEVLLRRRLQGELPVEADAVFTAHVLRLLGVPDGEAAAVGGQELEQMGQPGTDRP